MESLNSEQRITGTDSGVAPPPVLKLGFGMKFEDLYSCDGLPRIDSCFLLKVNHYWRKGWRRRVMHRTS
jgi:hypothetical protein